MKRNKDNFNNMLWKKENFLNNTLILRDILKITMIGNKDYFNQQKMIQIMLINMF